MSHQKLISGKNEVPNGRHSQRICRDPWTGSCLNQECWAFQNVDGKYYCAIDGLPANPYVK